MRKVILVSGRAWCVVALPQVTDAGIDFTARGFLDGYGLAFREAPPDPERRRYKYLFGPW